MAVQVVVVAVGGRSGGGVMLLQGGFEITCVWGLLEAPRGLFLRVLEFQVAPRIFKTL